MSLGCIVFYLDHFFNTAVLVSLINVKIKIPFWLVVLVIKNQFICFFIPHFKQKQVILFLLNHIPFFFPYFVTWLHYSALGHVSRFEIFLIKFLFNFIILPEFLRYNSKNFFKRLVYVDVYCHMKNSFSIILKNNVNFEVLITFFYWNCKRNYVKRIARNRFIIAFRAGHFLKVLTIKQVNNFTNISIQENIPNVVCVIFVLLFFVIFHFNIGLYHLLIQFIHQNIYKIGKKFLTVLLRVAYKGFIRLSYGLFYI